MTAERITAKMACYEILSSCEPINPNDIVREAVNRFGVSIGRSTIYDYIRPLENYGVLERIYKLTGKRGRPRVFFRVTKLGVLERLMEEERNG